MPNYNNSKIYKIWSPTHPDDIYIGSTTQPLSKRIGSHRRHYKQYQNGKRHYTSSYKILEYGDAKIELIENVNCNNKEQLVAREGHYIRTMDCVNKNIAGRTDKQYYQDNKERILQQTKQYQQYNKEQIKQLKKQYYQDNKERILQQTKQYQQYNKQKIKAYKEEKVTCECGAILSKASLYKHRKRQVHIKAMTK
jgi:hypothetical protein